MKPLAFLALAITASAADMFPFQLPWDDATPSITNVSWLNDKPAGRDGFVSVKDGHLFAGDKRLRIFGVNMCFSANFPKHEDAEKVAARMAKFGINCVRFHHMDMFNAPAGIFAKDGRTLDAEQLDRLDYFIAELKKNGIYADLNLHVSRTYPDRPKAEKTGNPQFDKGVDNYHAPMIALQKDYARDLLTHVNKYTGNSYAAEPAVALVEINNENALGFQWFAGELDHLPSLYREDLESQWGAWILKKHGSDEAARKVWAEGASEAGKELLASVQTEDSGAKMASSLTETPHSLTETSHLPTETSHLPTETSHLPTETSHSPTETSHSPTETSHLLTETSHLLTETSHLLTKTISVGEMLFHETETLFSDASDVISCQTTQKVPAVRWNFEKHNGAEGSMDVNGGEVSIIVDKAGSEAWNIQFSTGKLTVKPGVYDVRVRIRVHKPTEITVSLMQAHAPWKVLGASTVKAGSEWSELGAFLRVSEGDENARFTIGGMGQSVGRFEFAGFSLRTAGVDGSLVRDEKGRVTMVKKRDLARTTQAKQRDWQEFIWDTEIAYWNGMRDFLKKELGVKVPIVGTQGFWSPGHVQAGMDVIDSHAYWHHPNFEGGDWNPEKWTIKNEPMAGAKDGGTLPGLAAQRVAGKPFICTEYNHSAPNTYGAETAPLLAAFAALQDWDGVFLFAYSHGDKWQQEHFDSFFDIARHPVKMATLPGAAVSFRRGDVELPAFGQGRAYSREEGINAALQRGPMFPTSDSMLPSKAAFVQRIRSFYYDKELTGNNPDGGKWPTKEEIQAAKTSPGMPPHKFAWGSGGLTATLYGPKSSFRIGRAAFGLMHSFGEAPNDGALTPIFNRQDWACYQFTPFDGNDLATAKHILITATGDIANTDMGWKNAEKTTVGRDWGRAPVLVEGPAATIELPGGGAFKAWALDERGQRREELPVADGKLTIGPQFKTLWYEVERM